MFQTYTNLLPGLPIRRHNRERSNSEGTLDIPDVFIYELEMLIDKYSKNKSFTTSYILDENKYVKEKKDIFVSKLLLSRNVQLIKKINKAYQKYIMITSSLLVPDKVTSPVIRRRKNSSLVNVLTPQSKENSNNSIDLVLVETKKKDSNLQNPVIHSEKNHLEIDLLDIFNKTEDSNKSVDLLEIIRLNIK